MMRTYRVDYHPEGGDLQMKFFDGERLAALRHAAFVSRKANVGIAYAIARDFAAGVDVGQRVYVGGVFSHQDDEF